MTRDEAREIARLMRGGDEYLEMRTSAILGVYGQGVDEARAFLFRQIRDLAEPAGIGRTTTRARSVGTGQLLGIARTCAAPAVIHARSTTATLRVSATKKAASARRG